LSSALSAKGCEIASESAIKSLVANVAQNGKIVIGTNELAASIGRHLFAVRLKYWLASATLILALAAVIGLTGSKYGWFHARRAFPAQQWPQR
jgi:hypothetical protein